MPKLEQAHIVTNLQNIAFVKNAVGKDRQADHSPSMELTMCISNVHAILENMGYDSVFPVSAMSTEAYTNSTESRYCWNICSDNTVRVMLFCGGL